MRLSQVGTVLYIILLIPSSVVLVDIVISAANLTTVNPNFIVNNGEWEYNSSELTLRIDADLPRIGFIPKSIFLDVEVEFEDNYIETNNASIPFGDNRLIEISVSVPPNLRWQLEFGGSITFIPVLSLSIEVFSQVIPGSARIITLSPQTISF